MARVQQSKPGGLLGLLRVQQQLHCDEQLDLLAEDETELDCLSCESNTTVVSDAGWGHGAQSDDESGPMCAGKCTKADADELDELLFQLQDDAKFACAYLAGAQAGTRMTPVHRASVVDNMAAAAAALGLDNDSLFTGVACLDRYLAAKPTRLEMLQPTGIACLWLAAKYEQLVVPPAAQFAALMLGHSDGSALAGGPLARELLVALEADVLATLDYRLAAIVTVKPFKHRIMAALQASKAAAGMSRHALDRLYCMTSYLTEVSLLEYQLLPCPPSQLAAACVAYAHVLLGLSLHSALALCGCSQAELAEPMRWIGALHSVLAAALRLGKPYAVTAKYCSPLVCGVALVPPMPSPEGVCGRW